MSALSGGSKTVNERSWAPQSDSRGWMPPSATGRQWRRWPYGSFEMFKTSAVERRWNICPSWSAVERHQLYSIAGKRTGTAVSRHRGQRKLDWRLSCDCRQQAAFIDAPRRWYYASMRFLSFRSRFSQCVDYMRFNEKSFCFRWQETTKLMLFCNTETSSLVLLCDLRHLTGNISSVMTKHMGVQRKLHRFAYLIVQIISWFYS